MNMAKAVHFKMKLDNVAVVFHKAPQKQELHSEIEKRHATIGMLKYETPPSELRIKDTKGGF